MARYFYGGKDALDPELYAADAIDEEDRARLRKEVAAHHPLTRPHRDSIFAEDGKLYVKVPSAFWRSKIFRMGAIDTVQIDPESTRLPWQPQSLTLALPGVGYWVIPPGGSVDVPMDVPESVVKAICPHLLTEAEALARDVAQPAAVAKSPPKSKSTGV